MSKDRTRNYKIELLTYGVGNNIFPNKGREIDMNKPVCVYRCLSIPVKLKPQVEGKKLFSLKQGGKVVAHATTLMLYDVEFVVRSSGNKQCRKTKQKNVHAFAVGSISKMGGMGTDAQLMEDRNETFCEVKYNPMVDDGFKLTRWDKIVKGAMCVAFNNNGCSASYTH